MHLPDADHEHILRGAPVPHEMAVRIHVGTIVRKDMDPGREVPGERSGVEQRHIGRPELAPLDRPLVVFIAKLSFDSAREEIADIGQFLRFVVLSWGPVTHPAIHLPEIVQPRHDWIMAHRTISIVLAGKGGDRMGFPHFGDEEAHKGISDGRAVTLNRVKTSRLFFSCLG